MTVAPGSARGNEIMVEDRRTLRRRWLRGVALATVATLAGCGGGGSGGTDTGVAIVLGTPTPSPPSTPTPPPAPAPTAEQLEDQRSNAAVAANADAAYRAGATGRGVKIAIIDSGITPGLTEFSGRIDPASADMAGTRGLADGSGHGTFMASIALAARDGRGMHGVAYDATLVSFNVSNPATCTSMERCTIMGPPLIAAIDAAIAAKVRVINMSLAGNQTYEVLVAAVRRAAAAGIVTVISAGNNEEGGREPLVMPRSFVQEAPGWVIIAGGHDAAGGFDYRNANQAGTGPSAAYYLTALSRDVNMTDRNGSLVTNGGTSPAAAAISGAVALVAQARPDLTGAQIVALLLGNATDAGAPGRDPVYGNGILNLSTTFAALPPAG